MTEEVVIAEEAVVVEATVEEAIAEMVTVAVVAVVVAAVGGAVKEQLDLGTQLDLTCEGGSCHQLQLGQIHDHIDNLHQGSSNLFL